MGKTWPLLEWIFADIYHYAVGGQACLKIDKRKDAKTAKKALKAVDYKGDTIFSALLSKKFSMFFAPLRSLRWKKTIDFSRIYG